MPSYAQLNLEAVWRAQYVPVVLDTVLIRPLRTLYGLGPTLIGAPGDNNHLYGRHRSANWDRQSIYCPDNKRYYGTTDARDKRGDQNWYRAVDIGIKGPPLWDACRRLDAAVRAGQLPGVAEWFGTFDGQTVVGWYEGRPSSSDRSHLTHGHIGFWNEFANDEATMLKTYEIWTGTEEDDMALTAIQTKDANGDFVFLYPWNHTYSRVPKPPAGHTGIYWPLQNKLDALKFAGVLVNATVWPGPFNFADPVTRTWLGVEVVPDGAVELTAAQLAAVAAAAKSGAEAGGLTHDEIVAAVNEAEDS